jgi:hypothetical protein
VRRFRRIGTALIGIAFLLPGSAIADDVHITLGFSHKGTGADRKLEVHGKLHLLDGAGNACRANRRVFVIRKRNDKLKVLTSETTNQNGRYSIIVADKAGRYRIDAPAILGTDCESDKSAFKRHKH